MDIKRDIVNNEALTYHEKYIMLRCEGYKIDKIHELLKR